MTYLYRLRTLIAVFGSMVTSMVAFCTASSGVKEGYFEDQPYSLSLSFNTPMDTIAALSDWGKSINYVYAITTIICVFVFFCVAIPLIYIIRRFRVSEEDFKDMIPPKQIHGNATLEFIWTIVPCILLLFIAIPTWESIFQFSGKPPKDALVIEVIGHQWWWEFVYPDQGITTANEVHVPENTPVYFLIRSADVIHSFWIPQWAGKKDALPGGPEVTNHMLLTSPSLKDPNNKGGEFYQGACVELCGLSHALMRFEAVVHTKDEFERWTKSHNTVPLVQSELEQKGERVFAQCSACHTIHGTPSEESAISMAKSNPPIYKIGPNLTNFGSRRMLAGGLRLNTEENFTRWVKDPESLKPGSKMKALGLSDEDIKAVAAYVRFSTAKTY